MISKNEKRTDPGRAFRARAAHRRRKIPQVIEPCAPRGVPSEERLRLLVFGRCRDGRAVGNDAVAAAAGGVLRVPRQEGRERRGAMKTTGFSLGNFSIESSNENIYLIRIANDSGEKVYEACVSLERLCLMAKLLKAYARNEKKRKGGVR